MIKALKPTLSTVPERSSSYLPSQDETIANGNSHEFSFNGKNGEAFGVSRISIGSNQDLNDITVTAKFTDDITLFQDVKASVLASHFKHIELLFPKVINRGIKLNLTVTNNTGSSARVAIQLIGYDAAYLSAMLDAYKEKGTKPPEPLFLYANQNISAGASDEVVDVNIRSVDLEMVRATIKTDSDANMVASLTVNNIPVKNKVFVQQFNDEYLDNYATVPYLSGKSKPLGLKVDNLDGGNAYDLSFFAECYKKENQK